MGKLRFRLGRVKQEAVRTLHVALENGSFLHVNEHQKIRHYRAIGLLENNKKKN